MKDKIVESVIQQFQQRSEVGIAKYGTTLEDNNTDDFLQHLKEELMDAVLYIEKLRSIKYIAGIDPINNISESLGSYKKYNDLFNQKDRRRI